MRAAPTQLIPILAFALAVRLVNLHLMSGLPIAEYQLHWREADMATNFEWSGRILRGDILGRDTVHQYTGWMEDIAPLETWERWWGGKQIFHQAPLYAYALAAMRLLAGDRFWGIGLCQALLGVANVALVFLLAARLFQGAVPAIAGLAAALYGPFLLHEAFLLRDTLAVTTSLLLLWWLAGCGEDTNLRRWLVAGVLFAVAILTREPSILFGPFVLLWIAQHYRHDRGMPRRVALAFLAGVTLGLTPLVARNLLVGAPPLALSTRAIETFIHGNAADSAVVGLALPAETRSILERADGHLVTGIRLTLATYRGDWLHFVGNELFKLRAIFARYEGADNINWYYYVDRSPLLRFSIHFEHALALGMIGLWLDRRNAGRHRILWYFLVSAVAGLMYGTIVGRYRLPAVAILLIYAAAAVQWAAGQITVRHWRPVALAGLAVTGILVASGHLLPDAERRRGYRSDEFYLAARAYYELGQRARAFDELRVGLEKAYAGPDQRTLPPHVYTLLAEPFVRVAHELGRDSESAAALERVASAFPADASLQRLLGLLYRDALRRPAEAADHLERAERLEGAPVRPESSR